MRLIDADALGNRLYHEVFEKDSEDQRWDSGCWMRYRLFEKVLREQPTVAQPERKRGKWIRQDRQDNKGKPLYGWYQCSECGAFIGSNEANFCSECGADMREDDHETN